MKRTIRNIVYVFVTSGLLLAVSSCSKHTCPTYSKVDSKEVQTKA